MGSDIPLPAQTAPGADPRVADLPPFSYELAGSDALVTDILELPFDARERSRLRARLLSGQEIGIDLPVGTSLQHGSKLRLADGRIVAIEAANEELLEVRAASAAQLARIAYHIGNRHVPIQVGDGWLRILPDHVLQAMVEGLGGDVLPVCDRFQPESGAYGHGNVHHHHDDEGHGGRIHTMDGGGAAG